MKKWTFYDYNDLVQDVISNALTSNYYEEYFDSSIFQGSPEDIVEAIYSDEVLNSEVYDYCALEWGRWENEHRTNNFSKTEIESIIDASRNIRYLDDGRRDELIESKNWGDLLKEVINYIWDRHGYNVIYEYVENHCNNADVELSDEEYDEGFDESQKRTAWKYNNLLG